MPRIFFVEAALAPLESLKTRVWFLPHSYLHHASMPQCLHSYSNFTSLFEKKKDRELARVESPPRLSSCVNYNSFKKIQEIYLPTYTKDHSKENNSGGSTPSSAFHQESTSQRTFAAASRFCKIAKPLKSSKILPPPPSAIST